MKLKYFTILFFTLVLTMLYLSDIVVTWHHENAHQQIYQSYGVESYIKVNYNPFLTTRGYTQATDNFELCDSQCRSDHNSNEIIGYHFSAVLFSFWMMFAIFMLFQFYKLNKYKGGAIVNGSTTS